MKILFLDVDGVINSRDSTNFKNNLWPVDDYMCYLVGKIQLYTDCSIVISSSWRHHPEAMDILKDKFNDVIDKTPDLYDDLNAGKHILRGDEIQAWLDNHPEVTRYAILDDDSDILDEQKPNFFKTTFKTGLTDDTANSVIEHLNS